MLREPVSIKGLGFRSIRMWNRAGFIMDAREGKEETREMGRDNEGDVGEKEKEGGGEREKGKGGVCRSSHEQDTESGHRGTEVGTIKCWEENGGT